MTKTTLDRAFRYCAEHIEQDRRTNGDEQTDAELAMLAWVREKIDEHARAARLGRL